MWGKGKKGSVMLSVIYKVCPGSQHLFNVLSVHLKNRFMRMECLILEYLQPGVPPCPPHLSAAQVGPTQCQCPHCATHTPVWGG